MGVTNRPLTILVSDALAESPEIKGLHAQGHRVIPMSAVIVATVTDKGGPKTLTLTDADLVLGTNAWWFEQRMLRYLDTALKAARKRYATAQFAAKTKAAKGRPVRRTPPTEVSA